MHLAQRVSDLLTQLSPMIDSYGNHSIDFQNNSINWFLFEWNKGFLMFSRSIDMEVNSFEINFRASLQLSLKMN